MPSYPRTQQASRDTHLPALPEKVSDVVDFAKESGLSKCPLTVLLTECLVASPDDKAVRELLALQAMPGHLEAKVRGNPLVASAPTQDDLPIEEGSAILGQVRETGARWTLGFSGTSNPHILVYGRTGGGKSSWALMLAAQLLAMQKVECDQSAAISSGEGTP